MTDSSKTPSPSSANPAGRRKGLTLVATAVAVAAVAWGGWHWVVASRYQTTDNAYVAGNVVQITPQVGGTVLSIGADDTDYVRAGQVLVQLDPADYLVQLAQAESQLAQTARQTRTLYANNAPLAAQVAQREADLQRLKADAAKARDDVERRRPLTATGAVGKEEFEHAQAVSTAASNAVSAADAAVRAAKAQLAAAEAQTQGSTAEDFPAVMAAAAKVREAYLALQRTRLVAPVDGYVAKRGVQLGQRVAAGAPLMTVVDLHHLWVDANFKESQLADLRMGQKVALTADVYGDKTTYEGQVVGLGAGTGAAFSLLPAQNATGNWIKVVQRVPVRISLAPEALQQHPLRVGLSMDVKVDIRDQDGLALANAPRTAPVAQTTVYDGTLAQADARIARLIAGERLPALKTVADAQVAP
ncbi:HlyD family efflux transporter periplasmic adaptor subunit [Comamonas aquatica]|uniref:HlyD family efflux transporter periplasmic adaptor subunit n=2 Tax=Comamonas aquatica TaxID=225991 RepID=A0AA42W5C3_9BURK|nr:HlyD family efflux transporter periplasmic adaptor subunit [Comamonas aquatica]MDH0202076.1 HlyD family efflux transporter periplasmic adaptor subunit [Comamonas aquatica]MDH0363932.1 HlyD family efflux transporter periplasmic adaptor subunit [Comamonas aquatica]MDH1429397.1 HlyD family efflux transporter periplasmic adaptor subunit [Comamonas aquatica]MDH1445304.1 HlyD family efflux transporter periplasmic adaptor subunit [Comamonas aquatica]MDH1606942.1 HlyD family efflux transporter peri